MEEQVYANDTITNHNPSNSETHEEKQVSIFNQNAWGDIS